MSSTTPLPTHTTKTSGEHDPPAHKKDRILFGSCNSHHYEQVLWPNIISRKPSAFVWGGDAIYADQVDRVGFPKSKVVPATPERLQSLYRQLKEEPGYKKLLDTAIPIFGALDDHDYGVNNGDRTYRYRTESGTAFACEFLGLDGTKMCERAKKGLGAYGVKVMDFSRPRGQELLSDQEAGLDPDAVPNSDDIARLSNKSVAIFLLDVRSNKAPYTKDGLDYGDYSDGADFLGEEQWRFFQEAMQRSTAAVNIIVQGLQVHPDRMGTADTVENWSNFPLSRHRLYQTALAGARAPILVSGDVHHAQMLQKNCRFVDKSITDAKSQRPLLEVTTSGMTHSWGTHFCSKPETFLCAMKHAKFAARHGMLLGHWLNSKHSWTDLVDLSAPEMVSHDTGESTCTSGYQFSVERNFAEFEFDWEDQSVTIRIFGIDVGSPPMLSSKWPFDFLSGTADGNIAPNEEGLLQTNHYLAEYRRLADHGGVGGSDKNGDWICLNYRGNPSRVYEVIGFVAPVSFLFSVMLSPFWLPVVILVVFLYRLYRRRSMQAVKEKLN